MIAFLVREKQGSAEVKWLDRRLSDGFLCDEINYQASRLWRGAPPRVDLGLLLWRLCTFYGTEFNRAQHAVSVRHGGIVDKPQELGTRPWPGQRPQGELRVLDPDDPSKNMARGTYRAEGVCACVRV